MVHSMQTHNSYDFIIYTLGQITENDYSCYTCFGTYLGQVAVVVVTKEEEIEGLLCSQ